MAEYKISRLKFTWKGDWQPSLNYIVDDVVRFGGKSYVCIKRHTSSTQSFYVDLNFINQETIPASNEPRWELMFDGYEWRGDWTPFTTYNVGDIVKYKSIRDKKRKFITILHYKLQLIISNLQHSKQIMVMLSNIVTYL